MKTQTSVNSKSTFKTIISSIIMVIFVMITGCNDSSDHKKGVNENNKYVDPFQRLIF